jgi:hypothetical protein
VPATERAETLKKKTFDLSSSEFEQMRTAPSIQTPSSKSSSFQFNNDYLANRDPLKEFFALVKLYSFYEFLDLSICEVKQSSHEHHLYHKLKHSL